MSNRQIIYYGVCLAVSIGGGGILLYAILPSGTAEYSRDAVHWTPPEIRLLPPGEEADQVKYGRELIVNTSAYFGPKGIISRGANGMNCGNCHLDGGTRMNANNFSAVASTYPKFRKRSGIVETIEFRINDCFLRSMNGSQINPSGREMKAIVAYIKWLGKDVTKDITPIGAGIPEVPFLDRTADPNRGRLIFRTYCMRCHQENGQGLLNADSSGFLYPPLWGNKSFNVSAGMYRISRIAAFAKHNMPFRAIPSLPQLSDEDAWDVAAYIVAQERPVKFFEGDWPEIGSKPVDYPFGPFSDTFPSWRHKFGPFKDLKKTGTVRKSHS